MICLTKFKTLMVESRLWCEGSAIYVYIMCTVCKAVQLVFLNKCELMMSWGWEAPQLGLE